MFLINEQIARWRVLQYSFYTVFESKRPVVYLEQALSARTESCRDSLEHPLVLFMRFKDAEYDVAQKNGVIESVIAKLPHVTASPLNVDFVQRAVPASDIYHLGRAVDSSHSVATQGQSNRHGATAACKIKNPGPRHDLQEGLQFRGLAADGGPE